MGGITRKESFAVFYKIGYMSRTRELLRFTWLIAAATALTIALLTVVDLPSSSAEAQQVTANLQTAAPPPVIAAQPVVDLGNAFAAVAEAVEPSIVFIAAEIRQRPTSGDEQETPFDRFFQEPRSPRPQAGSGSGFIISADGYILTNHHVVRDASRLTVTLVNGTVHNAEVVGSDPLTDVAVIKIDQDGLTAAALGDSDPVRVGDWVLAFGSPFNLRFTVTAGIVSARGRRMAGLLGSQWAISDFIQTDAAINPGNSGGPLVNIHGQVVGINSAIASNTGYYAGYGFAIPINLVRHVSEQLIADGTVTRSALGVQIQVADQEDAEYAELDEIRGVKIQGFSGDNSPAEAAGLRRGDLIIELDGEDIEYVAQLQQIIGFKRPGTTVDITVARRGGERRTYSVRLIRAVTAPTEPTLIAAEPDPAPEENVSDRMGVAVERLPERWASRLGADNDGLVVTFVDPDGPARSKLRASNVQRGTLEVITHMEGERVLTKEDFNERLATVSLGGIVDLRVTSITPDNRGQLITATRVVRVRTR